MHIVLRQLQGASTSKDKIRVELAVLDSGKGISKEFLKNQLFHPFSQENPLQTGTGLGLAIVNSIVRSKSVGGSVDVWSVEGSGTEIRVTMDVDIIPEASARSTAENTPWARNADGKPYSVSFLGFNQQVKGENLLRSVIQKYLDQWWGFTVLPEEDLNGDILVVNEDHRVIQRLLEKDAILQPVIVLSSFRGDSSLVSTVNAYEKAGGFCRIVYKPGGPSRLRNVLRLCVEALVSPMRATEEPSPLHHLRSSDNPNGSVTTINLMRRRSDEVTRSTPRPQLHTRSSTYQSIHSSAPVASIDEGSQLLNSHDSPRPATPSAPPSPLIVPTMPKKPPERGGGTMRVLIVEDNQILRDLL